MAEKRESNRVKESNQHKVLDEVAHKKRLQKTLQALEKDTFHEDPHAVLDIQKNAPTFGDTVENKRRKLKTEVQ